MATQRHEPYSAGHPVDAGKNPSLLPNFLIVGAGKSGTTSLYHYLRQHPDVYMPANKEPEFFAADEGVVTDENSVRGWRRNANHLVHLSDYQALFVGGQNAKARGEASAVYLYLPEAAHRIKACVPDAEILVILRNPVERAYSAYLHHIREGLEELDFAAALRAEPERIAAKWSPLYHYRTMGRYGEQLSHYYRVFGPDKMHVYLYDDLREDATAVAQDIFGVLGVDTSFVPNAETRHNISGVPKNKLLHRAHHFLKGSNQSALKSLGKRVLPATLRTKFKTQAIQKLQETNLVKPPFPAEVREDLANGYRDDVARLQELIVRDLRHWLEV